METNIPCMKITYVVTDCVVGEILVEAEEIDEHRTKSIVNSPAVHLTTFFSASNTDVSFRKHKHNCVLSRVSFDFGSPNITFPVRI
jgi:hypothetical protein